MLGVLAHSGEWNLVGAPCPLDGHTVDLTRPRPALGRTKNEHRPPPRGRLVAASRRLNGVDRVERGVERDREALVNRAWLFAVEAAGDERRLPTVPPEEFEKLVLRDSGEHGRVRDLVAVEMQDRQNRPVAARVQELVRVPARGHRARLRLAVTDDARDEELRVVERGSECMGERISELTAFVDRARRLRCGVARNPAGERELPEELPHAVDVLPDVGVALAVRPLEVRLCHVRGTSVTGTGDEDRIELPLANRPVEVHVDEIQPRRRAEVTEQTWLDVLRDEAFRAAAGCRAGRSDRPTGSWTHASSGRAQRHRSVRAGSCSGS